MKDAKARFKFENCEIFGNHTDWIVAVFGDRNKKDGTTERVEVDRHYFAYLSGALYFVANQSLVSGSDLTDVKDVRRELVRFRKDIEKLMKEYYQK
ncbi:MAG TPA: hypothetical protein PLA71_00185 [Saccharofermentans sp.]|nr:hypothetical protein [Saccharofermentans sp.]